MFRILLFAVTLAAAAVWVEPRWDGSARTLALRVRDTNEVVGLARRFGRDMVVTERESPRSTPPVAAPARARDQLTDADRRELNRLIEERLRESPAD